MNQIKRIKLIIKLNKLAYIITFIYAVVFFLFPDSLIGRVLRNELKYLGVVLVSLIVVSEILKKKNEGKN